MRPPAIEVADIPMVVMACCAVEEVARGLGEVTVSSAPPGLGHGRTSLRRFALPFPCIQAITFFCLAVNVNTLMQRNVFLA